MAIPADYVGNVNNQASDRQKMDRGFHATFPEKYDFIQVPTLVGPYRALLYHKLRQMRYSQRNGDTLGKFMLKQARRETRKQMFAEWVDRGNHGAKKLGITLPEELPVSGYGEIYGELLYHHEGFIPGSNSTVIDVGAQYGDYSVLCAKVYGAKVVHAFEPIESNLDAIRRLILANNTDNVKVHPVGLSDDRITMKLNYNGEMLSTSNEGSRSQIFQFDTLDSFRLGCDLLKIDVEGFEMKVLKGGLNTIEENMPRVIMEVHSRRLNKASIGVLKEIGYRLVKNDKFSFLNGYNQNLFLEPIR